MNCRASIEHQLRRMRIGDCIQVDRLMVQEAYPYSNLYGVPRSTEEAFLQTRCGAAYGSWRIWYNHHNDSYTIARCKEGKKRVAVSSDRAWMYDRQPDGTYELKPWVKEMWEKDHECKAAD